VTILDAVADPALFASAFPHTESWDAWRTFLAACFGLPMAKEQLGLYRQHTGRQSVPTSPAREAWLVVGRRGGKSRIAALVAVYLACFRSYVDVLAPGERGTLPIIAADRRQARTVFRYVNGLLDGCRMLASTSPGELSVSTGMLSHHSCSSGVSPFGIQGGGSLPEDAAILRAFLTVTRTDARRQLGASAAVRHGGRRVASIGAPWAPASRSALARLHIRLHRDAEPRLLLGGRQPGRHRGRLWRR